MLIAGTHKARAAVYANRTRLGSGVRKRARRQRAQHRVSARPLSQLWFTEGIARLAQRSSPAGTLSLSAVRVRRAPLCFQPLIGWLRMSTPTDAELVALGEAGPLLRFAAEHVEALDPGLSLAIAEAVDAHQNQHWNPEISQKFWQAFAQLCTLIKPVTMECLAATQRNLKARSWFRFWRRGQYFSLAERTSSRYLSLLFFLLAVVTLPQLYIWVSANLSKQLDDLVKDLTVRSAQLTTAFMPIANVDLNAQQMDQAEKIKGDADALAADARRALSLLQRISSLGLNARRWSPAALAAVAMTAINGTIIIAFPQIWSNQRRRRPYARK